jgi:MscS family membrane protein
MNPWRRRAAAAAILWLGVSATLAVAQIPGLSKASRASGADAPTDPLGRSTPRGTIVEFTRAVDRDDLTTAALYLQLDGTQRAGAAALAGALKTLIDRELREGLAGISDSPAGDLEDGLPADREHIGPLVIGSTRTYIVLVHVNDPANGPIWLVSSETLHLVPLIARAAGRTWIERTLPDSLLKTQMFGLSLAHWCVLLVLLVGSSCVLVAIALATRWIAHTLVQDPQRRRDWDAWYEATRWPAVIVTALLVQFIVVPELGFPLTFRVGYARIGKVVLVISLAWLLKAVLTLAFGHARAMVRGKDRASTQSLLLLVERMLKALLAVVAVVALLILLGVESKTALAGLGIVGVALALGAQKTVENLLGGIFLLSDKALAVGDYCTIGNQSGTVEDVTLRSVRIRTAQQSLVSLPAGSLAQAGIENFATRHKMLALTTLRVRYGTSVAQLRRILENIRALLGRHARIEQPTAYIRLVNFGTDAIELELSAYLQTADGEEFRALREELLLDIASIVEAAGSALAPTRFMQLEPAADVTRSRVPAQAPQ